MLTESRLRNFFLHLILFTMLSLVGGRNASSETQALTLTSIAPSSGQAGTSSIDLRVDGLPLGVPLGNAIITLTPSGGGNPVTASAFQMGKFFDIEKKVSFIVPASISVNTPTEYTVSLSGKTASNAPLSSSNALTLTINPPPSITLSSSSGAAGQTIQIDITGVFTRFQQGITAANFGPGISVGSGSPGGWGFITVTSPTSATTTLSIDALATTGPKKIIVRTGAQEATANFTVDRVNNNIDSTTLSTLPYINNGSEATNNIHNYFITDLGTYVNPRDINDYGQVTGDLSWTHHAFFYSSGIMTDINNVLNSEGQCIGFGINNSGQVVGSVYNLYSSEHLSLLPFIYNNGVAKFIDLQNSEGFILGYFTDISNSGQIVGYSGQGFLYNEGNVTFFDPIGSEVNKINDAGMITGQYIWSGCNCIRAFIYSGGTFNQLGTLSPIEDQSDSMGFGINNSSQVVGQASTGEGSHSHAFLYTGGKMSDLGTLGGPDSAALAINDLGQIVGMADGGGAFLFNNGKMYNLNTLIPAGTAWLLRSATGINNSGQIIGHGTFGSNFHGFLLTPVKTDHFFISAPTSATSGSSFTFTVSAVDSRTSDSVDTAYSGTVHFTSSDGSATLPADVQLVNGVGTFTATLRATGNQTITATDTTKPELTGTSGSIAVGNTSQVIAGTVSIVFAGSGSGTVTSTSPNAAINCIKGSSNSCNASFPVLSLVTLSATSDWKSLFGGWSGGLVSSNNPISFTMIEPKVVTAAFTPNYKAKLLPTGTLFTSIQDAYSSVSSGSTTIQAQTYSFLEDLTFDNATDVTLNGGLNSAYNAVTGNSTIKSLTIEQGTVVLGNITVN